MIKLIDSASGCCRCLYSLSASLFGADLSFFKLINTRQVSGRFSTDLGPKWHLVKPSAGMCNTSLISKNFYSRSKTPLGIFNLSSSYWPAATKPFLTDMQTFQSRKSKGVNNTKHKTGSPRCKAVTIKVSNSTCLLWKGEDPAVKTQLKTPGSQDILNYWTSLTLVNQHFSHRKHLFSLGNQLHWEEEVSSISWLYSAPVTLMKLLLLQLYWRWKP